MYKSTKKTCSLECTDGEGNEPIHEFVGPVKIILIDPKRSDYVYKKWGPAIISCIYILLVVCFITVIFFTLTLSIFPSYMNVHIAACVTGYQLLMPSGVLIFDPMFGAGTHLDPKKKRFQHLVLQFFGIVYILAGTIHLAIHTKLTDSVHGSIGLLATVFVFIDVISGIFALSPKLNEEFGTKQASSANNHRILGMITLVLGGATFCSGVWKSSFRNWSYTSELVEIPYVLTLFCVAYTSCILLSICWKLYLESLRS